jgi:hypothetical protein
MNAMEARPNLRFDELWLDAVEQEFGVRDINEANRRARVKWEWEIDG